MDLHFDNYHLHDLQSILELEDTLYHAKELYTQHATLAYNCRTYETAYLTAYRFAYTQLAYSRALHEHICPIDTPILHEVLLKVLSQSPARPTKEV